MVPELCPAVPQTKQEHAGTMYFSAQTEINKQHVAVTHFKLHEDFVHNSSYSVERQQGARVTGV